MRFLYSAVPKSLRIPRNTATILRVHLRLLIHSFSKTMTWEWRAPSRRRTDWGKSIWDGQTCSSWRGWSGYPTGKLYKIGCEFPLIFFFWYLFVWRYSQFQTVNASVFFWNKSTTRMGLSTLHHLLRILAVTLLGASSCSASISRVLVSWLRHNSPYWKISMEWGGWYIRSFLSQG